MDRGILGKVMLLISNPIQIPKSVLDRSRNKPFETSLSISLILIFIGMMTLPGHEEKVDFNERSTILSARRTRSGSK
jgi:hypothetical protein